MVRDGEDKHGLQTTGKKLDQRRYDWVQVLQQHACGETAVALHSKLKLCNQGETKMKREGCPFGKLLLEVTSPKV